ncbi:MAG: S-layer homology domain-containing protein [Candidatus Gracilibacteria bacterium]|nr:S-layer homology domain-containing protein [Candidatus Gracilibacteria bacterium]
MNNFCNYKKIVKFLIFYILYFVFYTSGTFASSVTVEQVFSDIDKSYKYYNELQVLYDKGIILPDENGELNPKKLLSRQEFVAIASESTCKKCIKPNTELEFIQKYDTEPFFDVHKNNKYFYCIANAKESNFVQGYNIGEACDDGTQKQGEIPFCINNNITLEEALAVILRMSGILTASEAEDFRQRIRSGENFPDLAFDVKARNEDGSVYSFYPDFFRALNYEVIEYDTYGDLIKYSLLEKSGDYLRPNKFISKEEFLRIAYLTLKANTCTQKNENDLSLAINVYNKECSENTKNCNSNINPNEDTYDFGSMIGGVCEEGVENPSGYIWRFYNEDTGEEIIKYGKYIDSHTFTTDGKWIIFLRVIDKCGNTKEVSVTLNINVKNKLSCLINIDKNEGDSPLNIKFSGLVSGGVPPYFYNWNFSDGGVVGVNKNEQRVFTQRGVYNVSLSITDSSNNKLYCDSSVNIKVNESLNCDIDSDNDFVNDCIDKCPLVKGEATNSGCPIFEKTCTSKCGEGYICTDNGFCIPDQYGPNLSTCLSSQINTGYIYANSLNQECLQCPCTNALDFSSVIRTCDILFPAIVSPDGRNIYGKGDLYEVK